MRKIKIWEKKKTIPFFIVLLKSCPPRYIDSLGNENYDVTPNFDEMVANGIVFNNASYDNVTRSIFGLSVSFLSRGGGGGLSQIERLNNISSILKHSMKEDILLCLCSHR
ncbi:hypothetical protein [Candidatus Endomicrobiellum trichonymphae]|uniref:hypothetical protein n=1 Tax=Endomicrobium trichonymphae TaxID=1408204 RepID=UPI000BAA6A23|nr:hypothetical protein [Candidatus Endomicrobium trichonymphae]